MDSPLNQFEDLLDKATLKQKREWLKVLVNKIQTEEQQENAKILISISMLTMCPTM